MLLLGALIGGFSKIIDFWFKDHTGDKQLLDKIDTTPINTPSNKSTNIDPNVCQCEDCKAERAKNTH